MMIEIGAACTFVRWRAVALPGRKYKKINEKKIDVTDGEDPQLTIYLVFFYYSTPRGRSIYR